MSKKAHVPVAIDLFAGAGGLSEGLLAAGIHVAVAVEKHPDPALTYAFNHPNTTVLCGDIGKLSLDVLSTCVESHSGNREVDLVAGGPPCQGFSPAGKRNARDPRNQLFRQFVRVVEHFLPRMFIFENVPGFAKLYDGMALRTVVDEFRRLGYQIQGFGDAKGSYPERYPILDAAFYGVPQHRKRFILVGWLPGTLAHPFTWPCPVHGDSPLDSTMFMSAGSQLREYVTVGDALGDLEFLSSGYESHCYKIEAAAEYQYERRTNSDVLFNHLATQHRKQTVRMYRHITPDATIRSVPKEVRTGKQTMRRLCRDIPSKAVLALPDDLVHYSRHRIPTVREMARLQSFDDDYVFLGKRTTSDLSRRVDVPQYTQVGNAVPPLLAKAIGRECVRCLGTKPVDRRELQLRRNRHSWVCGSSAFLGYSLASEAEGNLVLLDILGNPISLPLNSHGDVAVRDLHGTVRWTKKPVRRRQPKKSGSKTSISVHD